MLAINLDSLNLPKIHVVKIKAEGFEFSVLSGMLQILRRDHPILIIETGTQEVVDLLSPMGYVCESLPNSPNKIFRATVV